MKNQIKEPSIIRLDEHSYKSRQIGKFIEIVNTDFFVIDIVFKKKLCC